MNHAPKRFVLENGKLIGMEFERLRSVEDDGKLEAASDRPRIIPCDDVILAIGQENAFPWIERDIGIEFDKWDMPVVDKTTFMSTRPGVFFGGDAAWGPRTSSGRSSTGIRPRSRSTTTARASRSPSGRAHGMNLISQKMGLHEWSYSNDYDPRRARR